MAGLTLTGFERKRLIDIKADIITDLKILFGENIDTDDDSGFGQFVGLISDALSDAWEGIEDTYNSYIPSSTQGAALTNVAQLNGLTRLPALASTVDITFTGTDGTIIPIGMEVATSDTNISFVTIESGEISGGVLTLAAESKEAGPFEAVTGTLTEIQTPLFGVLSATNDLDADVGRDIETDPELRARRANSLQITGLSHKDALKSQLLNIDEVVDAEVTDNGSDVTVDGVPAHRYRCVVDGGDDIDIGNTIWANNPQAILSFGSETVIIQDITGQDQEVYFTRPTIINIYFDITVTVDANVFPLNGADEIKQNIVDFGFSNFKISDDVLINRFFTPTMAVDGVLDAVILMSKTSPATGTSNILIGSTETTNYLTTNIEVTVV